MTGTDVSLWEGCEDAGFSNDAGDYSRCMVYVLQALSEDCVNGVARPGTLKITGLDMYIPGDEGLIFVPILSNRQFVEWTPRSSVGGFVAAYEPDDNVVIRAMIAAKNDKKNLRLGENDLVETVYWAVLVFPAGLDGPALPAVIPLTRTKLKPFQNAMTKLRFACQAANRPAFSYRLRMRSVAAKNKAGQPYFNFSFGFDGLAAVDAEIKPNSGIYRTAVDLWQRLRDEGLKVDHANVAQDAATTPAEDGEVPF